MNCISASYTIRSDRTSYLFAEPSTVTEIAQSSARITSSIQNATNKFKSMDSFGDSEPAKQFASYLMVHEINSLDFICQVLIVVVAKRINVKSTMHPALHAMIAKRRLGT